MSKKITVATKTNDKKTTKTNDKKTATKTTKTIKVGKSTKTDKTVKTEEESTIKFKKAINKISKEEAAELLARKIAKASKEIGIEGEMSPNGKCVILDVTGIDVSVKCFVFKGDAITVSAEDKTKLWNIAKHTFASAADAADFVIAAFVANDSKSAMKIPRKSSRGKSNNNDEA